MLILRIRQAETALKDGRLDAAYELARADDLQSHRRGQDLIGRLARALVERGRGHLTAERWSEALADCQKAGQLAGNLDAVADLKAAITTALDRHQREDRCRANALAEVRQCLDAGHLSLGEGLLQEVDGDATRAGTLQKQVAARRASADAALARVRAAMAAGDWDTAIDGLKEAQHAHAANHELPELRCRLAAVVVARVQEAVDQGRLDLAGPLLDKLAGLTGPTSEVTALAGLLDHCREAMRLIEQGWLRQADEVLRRVCTLAPGARWAHSAQQAVSQAATGVEHIRGGPLGLVGVHTPGDRMKRPATVDAVTKVLPNAEPVNGGGRLPSRFMLQVDGVGSYLVLRDAAVTVGPVSSSARPDVGLLAEAGLPVARIERHDDDYFLAAERAVSVNETPTTRRLLANGDRIALSPRCRLRFEVPSAASTSAVLNLSGARLPQRDARRVILMDRSLVIGPGPGSHVRADSLAEPVVLHVRDGRLCCQTKEPVLVGDRPSSGAAGLPLGVNVRVGSVSFVVTRSAS